MKAYLIDPAAKAVTEVDYDGDYKSIYKLIGADLFDTVRINRENDVIFVDDEGLLKPQAHFWRYGHLGHDLCGKGLVLGTDDDGDSISPKIALERVQSKVVWLAPEELGLKPDEAPMSQTRRYDHVVTPLSPEAMEEYFNRTPNWAKED